MGKLLYEILLGFASILRIPQKMFARAVRNQDSNLIVLLYHDVTKSHFEVHMRFLERHFEFIDLDGLVSMFGSREFPSELTATITFDDGLQSFYDHALPVVDEMGIPVTNYVTSGVVDSMFWLDKPRDKIVLREDFKSNYANEYASRSFNERGTESEVMPGLTLEELREADKHSHVTIGAHSVSHKALTETSYDVCREEIFESKAQLEMMLGHPVSHFAYPYGLFSSREAELVREAGFVSAAAFFDKWVSTDSDMLCFPRKGTGPRNSSTSWLKYRIGK